MPGGPGIDPAKAALAMSLEGAGYTNTEIGRKAGLAESSVRSILSRHGKWGEIEEKPVFAALRAEQNKHLEAAFRTASAQLLARSMDEDKLAKASTYQLVIASSVAVDKARLLAGESTENIAVHHTQSIEIEGAADKLAAALMRFSTTVLESENEAIDVTPTPLENKVDTKE